jgi:hypothetical protein
MEKQANTGKIRKNNQRINYEDDKSQEEANHVLAENCRKSWR